MTNPECPHLGRGHVRIPKGLEEARRKKKEEQLTCGSCNRKFNSICTLHSHLKGDSYHYDHITKTAFPLESCPVKTKGHDEDSDHSEDEEDVPTYYTQSGKLIGKMTRYKRKQHRFRNVYKIDKNEDANNAEKFRIELNAEFAESEREEKEADPSNVTFEYLDTSEDLKDKDAVAKSVIFEKDIFGSLPTEMLVKDKIKEELESVHSELANEAGTQTKYFSDSEEDLDKTVNEIPKVVNEIPTETGMEVAESTVHEEKMEQPAVIVENAEEVSNVVEESPQHINMQMTINLHSLETNPDGSLKIVVAEEDAGIFRTPQGEEILKALKEQAAKGVVAKNTQVVYNYTVPADSVSIVGSQKAVSEGGESGDYIDEHGVKTKRKKKIIPKPILDEEEEYEMSTGADGVEAVVFMEREERITTEEVINILEECRAGLHDDKISKIQPLNAKGGELYVVDLHALPDKRDVRHDKYLWIHCGKKHYPKQKPVISKAMYKVKLPNNSYSDGFQKTVFEPVDPSERYALVQYTGYESLFQPIPHGNRKYGTRAHQRTCPSVLEELRELSDKTELTPTMIHQQIQSVAPQPELRNVRTPRDLRQIRNYMFKAKRIAKQQHNAKSDEKKDDD